VPASLGESSPARLAARLARAEKSRGEPVPVAAKAQVAIATSAGLRQPADARRTPSAAPNSSGALKESFASPHSTLASSCGLK